MSDFQGVSKQILEIFFLHLYLFLTDSFYFCSWGALPTAHFIYCQPCYSWLSIYYRVSYFIDLTLNVFLLFLVFVSSLCWVSFITQGYYFHVIFFLFFFLTTCDSHGTQHLAFGLVVMHSAAAILWALMKYSSCVCVCVCIYIYIYIYSFHATLTVFFIYDFLKIYKNI